MKLSEQQLRDLCKQVTELLESEDWVLALRDKDGIHTIVGLTKPEVLYSMLAGLNQQSRDLIEQSRKNFP
jgi:hypothetical protein